MQRDDVAGRQGVRTVREFLEARLEKEGVTEARLRGLPLGTLEENLRAILSRLRDAGVPVVLLGQRIPPSYGADYAEGFAAIYARLAAEYDVAFVPFLLAGVGGDPELNLPDGIHPNARGHERVADNVAPALRGVLERLGAAAGE